MHIMGRKEFWIKNISKKHVSLYDLNRTIPAGKSVDLLSGKSELTIEQVLKSAESGSIFNKRDKIIVRNVPPQKEKVIQISLIKNASIPTRERSTLVIKEDYHEELDLSNENKKIKEEMLASENSDIADENPDIMEILKNRGK